MDRRQRYIAAQLLDNTAVLYSHQAGILHRVAHMQREGLSFKEYDFIMSRYEMALEEMRKVKKVADRLLHN
jgi:5-bromo-4-chloroindolyl phosphate hydrolysis protein